jgi:hypothetical protein
MRQSDARPSVLTLTVTPTLPARMPLVATNRRYSRLGIFEIRRAGVNP